MSCIATLRELFRHNDWARDRLLESVGGLSSEQLDRPFEVGCGSLRATLHHLWAAERIWLDRWCGRPTPQMPSLDPQLSIQDFAERYRQTGAERDAWLAQRADDDMVRPLTFTNTRGETYTFRFADMLLHVCNHGVHHRAQALNMLRHAGVKPPWLDYLALRRAFPDAPAPTLHLPTVRHYLDYGAWAFRSLLDVASTLVEEQWDRPFEIGVGSLRKTLLHIRFAEQWWLNNWREGPDKPFPELPEETSMTELRSLYDETETARNAFLAGLTDDDLLRNVAAQPRPGTMVHFSLGETMLQLGAHGTHHRAQALNMLRRLGATTPELDYVDWAYAEQGNH